MAEILITQQPIASDGLTSMCICIIRWWKDTVDASKKKCSKNTSLHTLIGPVALWRFKNTGESLENIKMGGQWEKRLKYGENPEKMGGWTGVVVFI